jgi:hypothetical protein
MLQDSLLLLDSIYKLYRFEILPLEIEGIRAYAFTSKYFSNADIIILNEKISSTEIDKVKRDVERLGFAVTLRNYKSLDEAEQSLFEGFFDLDKSLDHLKRSYDTYTKKISDIILNDYHYIDCQYFDSQKELVCDDNLVNQIFDDFQLDGPVLIVLEAAAGFGKTSTSYEVLNKMVLTVDFKKIPLFAELSRNRQATIFKYVLYDEIDRKFTGISLQLVYKHISEGRIPVIIDGFDELIKRKEDLSDESFGDVEPMLETIRELLTNQAKILLTTRRTAIFAGDDFHLWIANNHEGFTFKRYSISAPTIADWISSSREKLLEKAGLNLKSISNPVLLTNLRTLSDDRFDEALKNIDIIIEDYINRLMIREKERQQLSMEISDQKNILRMISGYFVEKDITSENKEEVEKIILEKFEKLLYATSDKYPSDQKPTIDGLLSKLTMHAFLDRKSDTNKQLGFVNDFIFGTFIGEDLKDKKEQWWTTSERYVDYLLTAYSPRSVETRREIYGLLAQTVLKYLGPHKQILIDNYLFGGINHDLSGEFIENLEFRNIFSYDCYIKDCFFSNCIFHDVSFDFSKVENTHFINCTFYNCDIQNDAPLPQSSFNNCVFDPVLFSSYEITDKEEDTEPVNKYEKSVLERFWPPGRERFTANRVISTLRMGVSAQEITEIDSAIDALLKREVIIQRRGQYSIELNIAKLNEIKKILNRN